MKLSKDVPKEKIKRGMVISDGTYFSPYTDDENLLKLADENSIHIFSPSKWSWKIFWHIIDPKQSHVKVRGIKVNEYTGEIISTWSKQTRDFSLKTNNYCIRYNNIGL